MPSREDIPCCGPFAGGAADYVPQRTDRWYEWEHDPPGHWARDLRDRQGGEICIEHGETAFFVDDLRILSAIGDRWLRANAVRSAHDAGHKKT